MPARSAAMVVSSAVTVVNRTLRRASAHSPSPLAACVPSIPLARRQTDGRHPAVVRRPAIPNSRSTLIGRLVTAAVLRETTTGQRTATLRIAAPDGEYVLVVFGRRAQALDRLPVGHVIHAEGIWRGPPGTRSELVPPCRPHYAT